MVGHSHSQAPPVKRCAVCKIDFKGRFVYVNAEVEELLGFSKDELFGRSFVDFLTEDDREIVNGLITARSNFETFFDSARIRLIRRGGEVISTRAVISLNFIAGSPVNFQMIIDSLDSVSPESIPALSGGESVSLIRSLLVSDNEIDWVELAQRVADFCRARQALVYRVDDGQLEVVNELKRDFLETLPPLCGIHESVVESGRRYGFTFDVDVRRAVELDGQAPTEFLSPMDLGPRGIFLLRLVFSEDLDNEVASEVVERAGLATDVLCRLLRTAPDQVYAGEPQSDVDSLVASLGESGVGVLQVDANGITVMSNRVLAPDGREQSRPGCCREFLGWLGGCNSAGTVAKIKAYFDAVRDGSAPEQIRETVQLPSGERGRLTIARQHHDDGDRWAIALFVPSLFPGSEAVSLHPDNDAVQQVVKELNRSSTEMSSEIERLVHGEYGELGEEASFSLQCLGRRLSWHTGTVAELGNLIDQIAEAENVETVDLGIMVGQILAVQRSLYPGRQLTDEVSELPRIATCRGRLQRILQNIISNSLKFAAGNVDLKITARLEESLCVLSIADSGPGIGEKRLNHIFGFSPCSPDGEPMPVPGSGSGLPLTRQLARSLGGDISIVSRKNEGTTVNLTVPVGQPRGRRN